MLFETGVLQRCAKGSSAVHQAFRVSLAAFAVALALLFFGESAKAAPAGPPGVSGLRSERADETTSTLRAIVDPHGLATTYRFEWGETPTYNHTVPAEFDLFAGEGAEGLPVKARISGLSAGAVYHYRLVATNSAGVTSSPDQLVETIGRCALPEGRCFELVSPKDVGPIDFPGQVFSGTTELKFQAAARSGALAYVSETGPPSATKGGQILSKALRGTTGWASSQLSPPISAPTQTPIFSTTPSNYSALNAELTCGVVSSTQPLTADPGAATTLEYGGINLYRQNEDGTYTAITPQTPTNIAQAPYNQPSELFEVLSLSEDCTNIIFAAPYYNYPGVPVVPGSRGGIYEWESGSLRRVTYVPSAGSEELTDGTFTGASEDGSKVFFTTQTGFYIRQNNETRKIAPEPGGPEPRAYYQYATPDGSRAFFVAQAGLTGQAVAEGRDLYEYDTVTQNLTDLTPSLTAGGSAVYGVIGAAENGPATYFVAQGQLVPGQGKTLTENQADNTFGVYMEDSGTIVFIATISGEDLERGMLPEKVTNYPAQTSRISPDGRFFLFEASGNLTGFESGSGRQVYIFDAQSDMSQAVTCISCRSDGGSPVSVANGSQRLASGFNTSKTPLFSPRTLVVTNGQPRVFFSSSEPLAPKAPEGENNLYEWVHGQVFLIAPQPSPETPIVFAGSSSDGVDLYFSTTQTLNWEDGDERYSVYDARIGGGFSPPSPPAAPCEASVEGSCQSTGKTEGEIPPAATQNPTEGNAQAGKKPKHHRKKHHRKKHHRKKHHHKKPAKHRSVRAQSRSEKVDR